jgi:hypothetical protein
VCVVIEPTDEMAEAAWEALPVAVQEAGELDLLDIKAVLTAVLAIVARDYTLRPRRKGESKFKGPRDHDFQPDDNPDFGSAFGGACGALVDTSTYGRVVCGWPRLAHRNPATTPPL